MSDLLQDHINSPEPYDDDDSPAPSRAKVQLLRDLADMSMDEQSVMLMPDSSTGDSSGFISTLQRKMESASDPPLAPQTDLGAGQDTLGTVQLKKKPGGTLAQPQDVSPFKAFVQICMGINLETVGDYGPQLEAWLSAAALPGGAPGAAMKALVHVLKKVNPVTAGIYGPLLDAWGAQATGPDLSALLPPLAKIMKLADPRTVAAYGPALDAWSIGAAPNAPAVEATMPEPLALAKNPEATALLGMAPAPIVMLTMVLRELNPDAAGVAGPLFDAFLGDPTNWSLFVEAAKLILPDKAGEADAWMAGGANVMVLPEILGEGAAVWGEMLLAAVGVAGPVAIEPVQGKDMDGGGGTESIKSAAAAGVSGSGGSLPHADRISASFGVDVSGIQAHVGGKAAEASSSMGAVAYATGNKVAFKSAPDVHTAAHEAAHVIQQSQGVSLPGGVGKVGDSYEKAADAAADRVVAGKSASDLLGTGGGAGASVQRKVGSAVQHEKKKSSSKTPSTTGSDTPVNYDKDKKELDKLVKQIQGMDPLKGALSATVKKAAPIYKKLYDNLPTGDRIKLPNVVSVVYDLLFSIETPSGASAAPAHAAAIEAKIAGLLTLHEDLSFGVNPHKLKSRTKSLSHVAMAIRSLEAIAAAAPADDPATHAALITAHDTHEKEITGSDRTALLEFEKACFNKFFETHVAKLNEVLAPIDAKNPENATNLWADGVPLDDAGKFREACRNLCRQAGAVIRGPNLQKFVPAGDRLEQARTVLELYKPMFDTAKKDFETRTGKTVDEQNKSKFQAVVENKALPQISAFKKAWGAAKDAVQKNKLPTDQRIALGTEAALATLQGAASLTAAGLANTVAKTISGKVWEEYVRQRPKGDSDDVEVAEPSLIKQILGHIFRGLGLLVKFLSPPLSPTAVVGSVVSAIGRGFIEAGEGSTVKQAVDAAVLEFGALMIPGGRILAALGLAAIANSAITAGKRLATPGEAAIRAKLEEIQQGLKKNSFNDPAALTTMLSGLPEEPAKK